MSNNGNKIYRYLKQVNSTTGLETGVVKANDPTSSDYVPPVTDHTTCPIVTWNPLNEYCELGNACNSPYVLNSDQTACTYKQTQSATAPTANGGTHGTAVKINNNQWNNGGAFLYDIGYASDGSGPATNLVTPHFWVNGDSPFSVSTRNTVDSRMNVAGIWGDGTVPYNEFIGFSRIVDTASAKTVYIGMSADNAFKFVVNGVTIVTCANTLGYPNFRYWNIYPVNLIAGTNYIEMYAENFDSVAGFAAEIYDITHSNLLLAAVESDLNIIFSTKNIVGQPFDLGATYGWSCPQGWTLINDSSGVYHCEKIITTTPTVHNTGMKGYSDRVRITNGTADGYQEPNNPTLGIGPYFASTQDLTTCPI
jgi:hypothetical protein